MELPIFCLLVEDSGYQVMPRMFYVWSPTRIEEEMCKGPDGEVVMRLGIQHGWWRIVLLALVVAALLSCGGGDDGWTETRSGGGGWVKIVTPSDTSPYEHSCNTVRMTGEAFISSTLYRCCSGSAEDTGVEVTWQNLSTGEGGKASQKISICYFLFTPVLCDHTWSIEVPLQPGNNTIRVRAAEVEPGTKWGEKEFVVVLPGTAFEISGHLHTHDGRPLSFNESRIVLELTGVDKKSASPTADGSFHFSCVQNGYYTLSPTSPLGQVYDPSWSAVTISGADVHGLDFTTEAYFVGGAVPVGFKSISVERGEFSISYYLNYWQDSYRLAVPNGYYLLTVDSVTKEVSVEGDDVSDVDF
jgi:hypothetical protein